MPARPRVSPGAAALPAVSYAPPGAAASSGRELYPLHLGDTWRTPRKALYVLCFSDDGPDTGPHPISQEELRSAFNPSNGWNVAAIERDRIQTRYHDDGAPAWFATIKRI